MPQVASDSQAIAINRQLPPTRPVPTSDQAAATPFASLLDDSTQAASDNPPPPSADDRAARTDQPDRASPSDSASKPAKTDAKPAAQSTDDKPANSDPADANLAETGGALKSDNQDVGILTRAEG